MSSHLNAAFLGFAGPLTLLAFLGWAYAVGRLAQPVWRERWRTWAVSALWSLAGAALAFGSVDLGFKVLSDETNLLSVANMLALFGQASNTQMWTYYYHVYHPMDFSVPSRPILFPLLTSLVHGVVGMRSWSPFVVNFACLTGLLFLLLQWVKGLGIRYGAALGWFTVLMSPVLLIGATSAGYDLCSLFFGFLAFLLWARYAHKPGEDTLWALFLTLVCFASVRYESIVALPLVALGVLWVDQRAAASSGSRFDLRRLPWKVYGVVLVLVLPLFVQRYLTWGSFENPEGVPPFSFGHLRRYFPTFLQAFFLDGRGPYPILLHWLGLGGLAIVLQRRRWSDLVPLVYCLFLLLLVLCHHFGLAGHPTQVRIFLPISFALSALALFFVARMGLGGTPLLAVFALLFVHHHQYSMRDPLTSQLTMTREMNFLQDFLKEEGKRGDLYIYDRPGQLSALGESAVSWQHFELSKNALLRNLKRKLYGRFLAVERVRYDAPPGETGLVREGYRLIPLREHQLTPEERLRISSVEW